MVAGDEHGGSTAAPPTFELERFVWGAPDLLRVSGKFTGLGQVQAAAPELVVRGPERMHRLSAIPDSLSPPSEDGLWSADFAWQEPPVAFDGALLELGPEIVVELPEPGAKRRRSRAQTLAVRTTEPAEGGPQPAAAERVHLEADLLAAREEIRELRADAERAHQELLRAREDLEAERQRHAGDAERFREGLATVQAAAAEALAAEQSAARQATTELRKLHGAVAARDAALAELRGRLEEARGAADAAHADGERMLSRLEALREAVGDGG
jgi:hypothetical protein